MAVTTAFPTARRVTHAGVLVPTLRQRFEYFRGDRDEKLLQARSRRATAASLPCQCRGESVRAAAAATAARTAVVSRHCFAAVTWPQALAHGRYMAVTWPLHGRYMAVTWPQVLAHGRYMAVTRRYMAASWPQVLARSAADPWLSDGGAMLFCATPTEASRVFDMLLERAPEARPALLHDELPCAM